MFISQECMTYRYGMQGAATMKKPPTKIRYENAHPQVSFRMKRETKGWLDSIRKTTGLSYSSILQQALVSTAQWHEYSQKCYDQGYKDGKSRHQILFRCVVCNGLIAVEPNTEVHQDIVNSLLNAIGEATYIPEGYRKLVSST